MKIAVIGHSHIACMVRAKERFAGSLGVAVQFVQLRNPAFVREAPAVGAAKFENCAQDRVERAVAEATQGIALAALCPTGNEHAVVSMLNKPQGRSDDVLERVSSRMVNYRHWLTALAQYVRAPAVVVPPPPPIESESHILEHPGRFAKELTLYGVAPASVRLQAWAHQVQLIREVAVRCGLPFLDLPTGVFSGRGFLREQFVGIDPTHGNEAYGELIVRHVADLARSPGRAPSLAPRAGKNVAGAAVPPAADSGAQPDERRHPYAGLPDRAYWKQAVAQVPADQFDPVGDIPFTISRADKVATAGSCFAQHISKRIRSIGFQFLVTEHPVGGAAGDGEARGFYDFSARFGNVYTARQLVQLFDRAYGYFSPVDSHWSLPGNRCCDPFRPRIEPDGFASVEALAEDRRGHFAAVREMFEQLDVFVFTLGLTECWVSRLDGAAYPIAPGVAGGVFDPARHEFVNFGVSEVVADLQSFIRKLRLVNPGARVLLTVSPVPLVATYEPKHVLVSTTYSKSVLRVAADMVSRSCENVCYFPSFEIITGNYTRGRYFGPDLRSVTEEGVDHVMSLFIRHVTDGGESAGARHARSAAPETDDDQAMEALAEAACDEELLERK